MGALERLTYLLGICVAVIGWGVTQLNATITAQNVVGYSISTSSDDKSRYKTIYFENLSKVYAPNSITVSFAGSARGCVKSVNYWDTDLRLPVDAPPSKAHPGLERMTVEAMPPGTSFAAEVQYRKDCNAAPTIELASGATQVRLLKRGFQTFVIRNEFGILALLVSIFSVVFAITFTVAYLKAPKS